MAGLKMQSVTRSFGEFDAVSNISLDVRNGEFLAVLGPSGCGKTTMLRLIAGFEQVTSSEISIGERVVSQAESHVAPEKRNIGIVFQNYALWPHMSVAENIAYPLRVAKVPKDERRRRVDEALALVDLSGFGDRRPANLSGGQRQRVALARCLVAAPSLVLFDEPLANLDVHLRASMEDEFARFHKRTGTTIVYITHDQAEAMALADRIAVMNHGRIVQVGTPREIYREPQTEMVASFIAGGMVLSASVLSNEEGGSCRVRVLGQEVKMRCREGEAIREGAKICCRAPQIELIEDQTGGIAGQVERISYMGGHSRVEFIPEAEPTLIISFELGDEISLVEGQRIAIRIKSGWVIPA